MKQSILLNLFAAILVPTAFSPAQAQDDLVYVAVEPCRIVDTRNAGGAITANTFRNFWVSGTVGELAVQGGESDCLDPKAATGLKPSAISAYVLAVPATSSTGGGVLTAYPSDQLPPAVGKGSTVNFAAGQVIGNTTNITLCDPAACATDGEFSILARSTDQHVVVDVQGYFYPTAEYSPIKVYEVVTEVFSGINQINQGYLFHEARCPEGKNALGGGYRLYEASGSDDGFLHVFTDILASNISSDLRGWTVATKTLIQSDSTLHRLDVSVICAEAESLP